MDISELEGITLPNLVKFKFEGDPVSEETAKDFILKTDPRLFYKEELSGIINEFLQEKSGFTEPQIDAWLRDDFYELSEQERLNQLVDLSDYLMSEYGIIELKTLASNYIYSKDEEYGGYGLINPKGFILGEFHLGSEHSFDIYDVHGDLVKIVSNFNLDFKLSLYNEDESTLYGTFICSGDSIEFEPNLNPVIVDTGRSKVYNQVDNLGVPSPWVSEMLYWIRTRIKRTLGIRL
tara:strand:+ start:107352 stop:108056 length:705 start_codon:yes stop_codon:yes gene_type:complete